MSEHYTTIFTLVELILIFVIVIMQTARGRKAAKKIEELKTVIPKVNFFKIKKFNISAEYLQKKTPAEMLSELTSHADSSEDEDFKENIISLVEVKGNISPVFNKVLIAINMYLLRNKGATTDFNLIKDITERNIDMEEEEINQTITTPLYLGLMGTILGIIFGLINFVIASYNGNDFEIQGFLIGVSIAMFASVYGLFWTVLNSNFRYKKANRIVEDGKNDFYTFVQTELLPVLSLSESSGFYAFNANLMKFNEDFTVNIDRLSRLLHKNYDAIEMQGQILQNLENIDITSFAKANVTILNKLTETTKDLSKFNEYIEIMNSSVAGTMKLSGYFMALLEKTDNFKGIAEKLDERVELNNGLLEFLRSHFEVLKDRGLLITDSVKNVDDILIKSLDELREHTVTKIQTIKEVTLREEDLMEKALEKNRGQLANLSLLKDLNQKSDELKTELSTKLEKNETTLIAILDELKKAQVSDSDDNMKIENLKTEVYGKLEHNGEVLTSILEELKKGNENRDSNDSESITKIQKNNLEEKLISNKNILLTILEELKVKKLEKQKSKNTKSKKTNHETVNEAKKEQNLIKRAKNWLKKKKKLL